MGTWAVVSDVSARDRPLPAVVTDIRETRQMPHAPALAAGFDPGLGVGGRMAGDAS